MFNKLKKLDVKATKTTTYEFVELEGRPKLTVKSATEANKLFYNQVLKRMKRNSRTMQAGQANAELLAANRDEDRELFPKYVITGWSNVVNDEGTEVPFNEQNCKEFLDALPDWLFDGLREFCSSPANFIEEGVPDVEDLSKN